VAILGGVGEVGKNCTMVEYDGQMLLIDVGVKFPESELHGVDLVIPDFGYVREAADDLVGILITHGHEDHIGAIPYLIMQLERETPTPIYATRLTVGMITEKLKEHRQLDRVDLVEIEINDEFDVGPFTIESIPVTHSVPAAVAFAVHTPEGIILHTGDYKFDPTPIDGIKTDEAALRRLGDRGVALMITDCVRIESEGWTPSEATVGDELQRIMAESQGRVIVTTFASNLARMRQVILSAHKLGRRTAVFGRSMEQNLRVAAANGYLTAPSGSIVDIKEAGRIPAAGLVLLTTGSQGEPSSVLSRMALGDHPHVKIMPTDTVIYSANPIPGNEVTVARSIDNLYRRGARVVYRTVSEGIHVSGHASREELKHMLELVRPRHVIPTHGEYRMLVQYCELAIECGVEREKVLVIDAGEVVELADGEVKRNGSVPAGAVFIDGLSIGDVTSVVLRDRARLADDGVVIASVVIDRETGDLVAGPDLMSRGFVAPNVDELFDEAGERVARELESVRTTAASYSSISSKVREVLSRFLNDRTRQRPLILPIVTEI
jgi:ribonuclease J